MNIPSSPPTIPHAAYLDAGRLEHPPELFDAEDEDGPDTVAALGGAVAGDLGQATAAAMPPLPSAGMAHMTGMTRITDDQLNEWLEAIVDHDERALTALYDATIARVYGIALRIVRVPALAEEVVEDTYFQLWRQAVRYDPTRGRALTWLLGMARSRAIDAVRREARFQHDSVDDDLAFEVAADPRPAADDLLAAVQSHADLRRALMQLHSQPRQLVAMAFFKGLSHEEIASRTALPLGTVKSQIRRALQTLRLALGERGMCALAS